MVFNRLLRTINPKIYSIMAQRHYKVAILGSAGGVGQHLSFYMKQHELVTKLALYDIVASNLGLAVDLSHLNTPAKVEGFTTGRDLFYAVYGADVIVLAAGVSKKLNKRPDYFETKNSDILFYLTWSIAHYCPRAIICVITDPINVTVPLVSETMQIFGAYNPAKILGITTLDLMRASTFIAEENQTHPWTQEVPVIGGNQGETIIPLLSQINPPFCFPLTESVRDCIIKRIRNAEKEVLKAKCGLATSTLSMALAASRFVSAVLRGLAGEPNVVETAYVRSQCTKAKYFSTPVILGMCGIQENLGIPNGINKFEESCIENAVKILRRDIEKGEEYVACKFDREV